MRLHFRDISIPGIIVPACKPVCKPIKLSGFSFYWCILHLASLPVIFTLLFFINADEEDTQIGGSSGQ
jgi:hypothetical protein